MIQALQTWREIDECREKLKARGLDFTDPVKTRAWRLLFDLRFRFRLPTQIPDYIKSWDVLTTSSLIEAEVPDRKAPILDMGCFNSEILYVLDALGYRALYGCDLNPLCRWLPFWTRIHYSAQGLTDTSFPDHFFAAASCVSVIEHGVDIDGLVQEARRILRPGGLFIFTTDYDGSGARHDIPADFRAFGLPWTIFNREGVHAIIGRFKSAGFTLLAPDRVQETHAEKPVSWQGQHFSFVLAALKAPAASP